MRPTSIAAFALPLVLACSASPEDQTSTANALANGAPRGNYGFLTDFTCQSEADARGRIDTLVNTFHVTDVQFYDWFADYSTPTAGASWTDPWFHAREICRTTILFYVDELHRLGARVWAYVQSIASEDANLATPGSDIFLLKDASGTPLKMGSRPLYFANAAWAEHQVAVWGDAVASLGFDGVHWDTLGPMAGSYDAETAGFHAFLTTAQPLLRARGLSQTMNFVNLSWWNATLLDTVAFPYAEVWSMADEQRYYAAMKSPAMRARWGVMPFYPSVDMPDGWTQSQVLLARWNEAPKHHLRYLVVGDGARRLVREYFPNNAALTEGEITALSQ